MSIEYTLTPYRTVRGAGAWPGLPQASLRRIKTPLANQRLQPIVGMEGTAVAVRPLVTQTEASRGAGSWAVVCVPSPPKNGSVDLLDALL